MRLKDGCVRVRPNAGWRSGQESSWPLPMVKHDPDCPFAAHAASDGQQVARALRSGWSEWMAGCAPARAMPRYNENTEQRILSKLDEPPPSGYATWTGALVADALGNVIQTPGLARVAQ